ncbi:MAG TPA: response regulator [Terriglobia bacterium]|nr:response regulator [Terriglobia bacterium]
MAQKKVFALLASDGRSCFDDLRAYLKGQGMEVWMAESCNSAMRLLEQTHPEVVFTAPSLADGTWVRIVDAAQEMEVPTSVIVVGTHADSRWCLSAIEQGAFDFTLPPFEIDHISRLAGTAAEDARQRREAEALKDIASPIHSETSREGLFPFFNNETADWRHQ